MKRNIAGLILSGLMIVLFAGCGGAPFPETTTLDGVTYTVIAKESDFDKVRSDLTGNYYLWRDLALTGDFEPLAPDIGTTPNLFEGTPFTGIFEGNDKTISNLGIAKSSEEYVGLFGQIGSATPVNLDANGVVRNLTLVLAAGTVDAPSVEGADYVGALAGKSYGKIEAVGIEGGFVKGVGSVGGLVGTTGGGDITSSYATGSVTGEQGVGGLVGVSYGNITSSYATGAVTGSRDYVGGLVGFFTGDTITSSYATGSVTGSSQVGGLVGFVEYPGSTITSSYATGAVIGTGSNVGGLVGSFDGDIKKSYATGEVTLTGTGSNVGGLVGSSDGDIKKSYATGEVTLTGTGSNVGGLVGYANSGTIERSYATGSVTLTGTGSNIGGLVGYVFTGTINSSYFDSSTEGTNQTNGIGRDDNNQSVTVITTSGITSGGRDPFAGVDWDFDGDDAVWAAQGDGQWPLLAWQLEQ